MEYNMQLNNKDLYCLAVKVLLVDDQDRLLIIKDIYDDGWDIPGGRLRPMDFNVSFEDVVTRKMKEELGDLVKYQLGEPVVYFRHEREEVLPSGENESIRIFAIGYQAKYVGGEINLGEYLKEYKWVPLATFVPEEYLVGGWLNGVKEFQEKYNKNIKLN